MTGVQGDPYVRNQDMFYNDDLVEQNANKLTDDQLKNLDENVDEITFYDLNSEAP